MMCIRSTNQIVREQRKKLNCQIICLRGRPTGEFFTPVDTSRLQILTYTRHLWPLSIVGSSACHTKCGMGHPFVWLYVELSLPVLTTDKRSVATGIRATNPPHAKRTLLLPHSRDSNNFRMNVCFITSPLHVLGISCKQKDFFKQD